MSRISYNKTEVYSMYDSISYFIHKAECVEVTYISTYSYLLKINSWNRSLTIYLNHEPDINRTKDCRKEVHVVTVCNVPSKWTKRVYKILMFNDTVNIHINKYISVYFLLINNTHLSFSFKNAEIPIEK